MDRMNTIAMPNPPITDTFCIPQHRYNLPEKAPERYEKLAPNCKLPKIWHPDNAVLMARGKLGYKLYRDYPRKEFDQSDMYVHVVPIQYNSLHDPDLLPYFVNPVEYRHLFKQGLIAEDGRILCDLITFNKNRTYLHHVWALEVNQLLKEEIAETKKEIKRQRKERADILQRFLPDDDGRKTGGFGFAKSGSFPRDKTHGLKRPDLSQEGPHGAWAKKILYPTVADKTRYRNLKELEDSLRRYSQSVRKEEYNREFDKRKMDNRLVNRWITHHEESEAWMEEAKRLRELEERTYRENLEDRERKLQKIWRRQKQQMDKRQLERKKYVESKYTAVKKMFEGRDLKQGKGKKAGSDTNSENSVSGGQPSSEKI